MTMPDSPRVHHLFAAEIEAMHLVARDPQAHGRVGCLWEIDPAWGSGSYWYFPIGDMMAVTVFDLLFSREVELPGGTPDCLCVGSYGRNMVPYIGATEEPGDRTLLGYVWRRQADPATAQVVRANEHLTVTSLPLLPPALPWLAGRLGCDPRALGRAATLLDGRREVPGMNKLLDEVRNARPSPTVARAYYEAKIVEAFALLYDWGCAQLERRPSPLADADRAALGAARTHILDNLDRMVPLDELCALTSMSASKLTRLFRQVEGTTVQDFARSVRLERAAALLAETDLSLAEISARLGFAHQSSLSKAFRERYGTSPRTYRSLLRR